MRKRILAIIAVIVACCTLATPAYAKGAAGHAGGAHGSSAHVSGSHGSSAHDGAHSSGEHATTHDTTVTHDGTAYGIHEDGDGNGTIKTPATIIPFHSNWAGVRQCDTNNDNQYAAKECPDGTRNDDRQYALIAIFVLLAIGGLALVHWCLS